jgi:CheY-like chemotaxis protein
LLLLTSVGQLGDLDEKAAAHFEAMIVKPVRSGQLADKVREIISRADHLARPVRLVQTPVPKPAQPVEQPETPATAPVAAADKDKITILVAEDNEVNRRVIAAMLADGGYDIHFAHDGVQAVDAYRRLQPDIVLMDVSMPHLDGLQATAQIRKLEAGATHTARVIGLTAHAMPDDRKICLDSGMDEYLAKPIVREKLLALLKTDAA